MFKKTFTSLAGAFFLALQAGNLWAASDSSTAVKRQVAPTTTTITGPSISCKKWGPIVVALKIKKTVTKVGGKSVVKIKILEVTVPVVPDHTSRSVYINKQALPLLRGEVLELQSGKLEVVSGATDTTVSYQQSLQAALLAAKKP